MSDTAIVGSAHVIIRALTDRLQNDIEKALNKSLGQANKAGKSAGDAYTKGFNESVKGKLSTGFEGDRFEKAADAMGVKAGKAYTAAFQRETSGKLVPNMDSTGTDRAAESAGKSAGDAFVDGFVNHGRPPLKPGEIGPIDGRGFVDHGRNTGRDAGDAFIDGAEEAIDNGGGRIHAAFTRLGGGGGGGGIFKALLGDDSSAQAGQGLRRAVLQMEALVVVGAEALSAITALASGLFAMGSAAAQAAPSLIALPGILGALVTGGIGAALAFNGIGDALKAGLNPVKQSGAAVAATAARQKSAARAVEAARRSLADAIENSNARIERAEERVADSEYSLERAQKKAMDAQRDVNQARLEAIERLQDLEFALRGGAIAEEEAILRLSDAQRDFDEVADADKTTRVWKERELALRSAQLRLDEIRERNGDLKIQEEQAAKAGVEGSAEVVQAKERQAEANRGVYEAQKNLVMAQRELQRTQRDAAKDIADAQRRVAEAQEAQAAASVKAAGGVDKFKQAMDKLSPAQKRVVNYLIAHRKEFRKVKEQAAAGLFDPATAGGIGHVERALRNIVDSGILNSIGEGLRKSTHEIGVMLENLTALSFSPFFRGNLNAVFESNARVIETLGSAVVNLADYMMALWRAAGPVTERFADWIEKLTIGARKSLDTNKEVEALSDKFMKAADVMAQLGDIGKNLWDAIKNIGRAATDSGQRLLDHFEKATERWAALDDQASQSKLADYFDGVADNVIAISSFLAEATKLLFQFGDDENVGKVATILKEDLLPVLDQIIDHGLSELGPLLADAFVSFAEAFAALQEAGALEVFVNILKGFADVIVNLMENPVTRTLIIWLVSFEAALGALALIRNFSGIGKLVGLISKLKAVGIAGVAKDLLGFNQAAAGAGAVPPPAGGAIPGGRGGRKGKGAVGAATGSADDVAAGAASGFTANMKLLADQFARTGAAKDAFILNLQRLSGQFATTGAAAAGAPAGAARGAAAGAGAAAAAPAMGVMPGGRLDPDPVGKNINKKTGALGKMGKAVKGLGGGLKGMGLMLMAPIAALTGISAPILLIIAAIAGFIGILVAAYKNSEKLQKIVNEAWKWIQETVVSAWNDHIQPALAAFAEWLGDKIADGIIWLVQTIQRVWPTISNIISFAWNNVIKPVFSAIWWFISSVLIPIIKFLWNNVIKPAFTTIGKIIAFAWNYVIKPVFAALQFYITKILIPVIKFLWNNVVKPAFAGISFAVKVAWAIIQVIFGLIKWWINNVVAPPIMWLWKNVISPAFDGIGKAVKWAWDNVIKPVFKALGNFITDTVAPAFSRGIDAIKGAWDKIQEFARAPVNFVIETVYNNGIKKIFDNIAKALNMDVRLPEATPIGAPKRLASSGSRGVSRGVVARERGGHTSPGLTLVGEKGPELVNFNRSGWVYNASTTKQIMRSQGRGGLGGGPVKGGLTWEGVMGAIAGAKDWVIGNLKKAAKKLIDPLLEKMNSVGGPGMFGKLLRGTVKKMADNVLGWTDKKEQAAELSGGTFSRDGSGWPRAIAGRVAANTAAAVNYVRNTWGISNIGTLGNRPNKSDHPMGKALDVMISNWRNSAGISLGNAIASFFVSNPKAFGTKYVIWRDRINSGSGWRPYVHPSGNTTNPTLRHMDHVHTSLFDTGGIWKSGVPGLNLSGADERVLSPRQTVAFEKLVSFLTSAAGAAAISNVSNSRGGDTFYVNTQVQNSGASANDIAEEILFATRRIKRGGAYAGGY